MQQIKATFILVSLCLFISGCTALRESKGYLNEDVANVISDVQTGLTDLDLDKKTSIIRNHP